MGSGKLGWLEISLYTSASCADDVKVNSRLKPENACCHSMQNLLSSSLLFKNLKIKIYRTIILPVVLYGCETWSFTSREERSLCLRIMC